MSRSFVRAVGAFLAIAAYLAPAGLQVGADLVHRASHSFESAALGAEGLMRHGADDGSRAAKATFVHHHAGDGAEHAHAHEVGRLITLSQDSPDRTTAPTVQLSSHLPAALVSSALPPGTNAPAAPRAGSEHDSPSFPPRPRPPSPTL